MRAIVKSAMKVGELSNQFIDIDNITWKQVDEFVTDAYMVKEAEYHLEIAIEWLEELKRFIKTWKGKCQPHKNDGVAWEELELLIKGAN